VYEYINSGGYGEIFACNSWKTGKYKKIEKQQPTYSFDSLGIDVNRFM
jgi:hypothetical protein